MHLFIRRFQEPIDGGRRYPPIHLRACVNACDCVCTCVRVRVQVRIDLNFGVGGRRELEVEREGARGLVKLDALTKQMRAQVRLVL